MKKLNIIIGMTLLAATTLFSCKDESGMFVEQLYTNTQKEAAIKACLTASADTAVSHLCVANGFYNYLDAGYRINYSPLQNSLFDTLNKHGYGYLIDTLILRTNRLAESCGSQVSSALHAAIDSLTFIDYDGLIYGDDDAITRHFELYEYRYLKSAFQSPVSIRFPLYHVSDVWSEMNQQYYQYTTTPLNFDIQNYIVEKMLEDILMEMTLEEEFIRTDSTHQTDAMKLLGD